MVKNNKIIVHFETVDPLIASLFKIHGIASISKTSNYFEQLCRAIIGQQLSGKAADSIFARFKSLFASKQATHDRLLLVSDEVLRSTGISWAKVRSLKDLAMKIHENVIRLDELESLSDEEIMKTLCKVKGIGPWTVEMFLLFSLGREDVFSFGDLGLKKAIQRVYSLQSYPSSEMLASLSKKWSPYRSYVARVLWQSLEV